MSIRTNKMKAVAVLVKRLGTARSKFLKSGRDESFDGKLEKLSWELNKIKDVFLRVKNNEDQLLDTLAEVDAHLPDDISSMKSLTHLILSQCYLLDAMPKGIETLTNLQVLKGFLIGSPRKTPCTISDLANLKQLRRLSIHIRSEAVIKDGEFESLGELPALKHLKISWGVSRYSDIKIILPSSLKKLHLEGFPGHSIPEWLKPSKLPGGFKQLKIIGGKLQSMNHDDDINKWGMEIVHLKYLKHLKVELTNLKELFPSLRYAEIKQISNLSHIEWSVD